MTERTNYVGKHLAPPPQSVASERAPKPIPSQPRATQTRSTRPETARQRTGREDAARRRAPRRKRKRRLRRRAYRAFLAVLAVVFLVSLVMILRGLPTEDKLKGAWTLDESTAYEFDGKGRGTLRLPLGSYAFSYTVEYNVVTLDFEDEDVTNASYSFLRDGTSLTLDTNTGTVYRLEIGK